jgi:hypothetical protein
LSFDFLYVRRSTFCTFGVCYFDILSVNPFNNLSSGKPCGKVPSGPYYSTHLGQLIPLKPVK